jgi:hypothetical protein
MPVYIDWIDAADLDDRVTFPFEPKGPISPRTKKIVIIESSVTSHDASGNFLPSVDSVLDEGVDSESGEFDLSGRGLPQATFEKLKTFFEADPPEDFIYYRARANNGAGRMYLVTIMDFDGEPEDGRTKMSWTMKLKNLGVVT